MQREILNPLSKEILAGRVNKEDVIGVTLNDQRQVEFLNLNEVEIKEK